MILETREKDFTQNLADQFWEEFLETVMDQTKAENAFDIFFGRKVRDGCDQVPSIMFGLMDESFKRVKAELGDKVALCYASPTRFHQLFFESLLLHSAVVKRERIPQEIPDYDVEADIKSTESEARMQFENMFRSELAFMKEMEAGHFAEAEIHLRSIEAMRIKETGFLLVEVLNWRMELAVSLGDVSMFLAAFSKMPTEARVVASSLENNIGSLISRAYIRALGVMPSVYGLLFSPDPSPKFFQQFADAMHGIWIKEIVRTLCRDPQMSEAEFREMITRKFEEKKPSFLMAVPQLNDIVIVWR